MNKADPDLGSGFNGGRLGAGVGSGLPLQVCLVVGDGQGPRLGQIDASASCREGRALCSRSLRSRILALSPEGSSWNHDLIVGGRRAMNTKLSPSPAGSTGEAVGCPRSQNLHLHAHGVLEGLVDDLAGESTFFDGGVHGSVGALARLDVLKLPSDGLTAARRGSGRSVLDVVAVRYVIHHKFKLA